MKKYLFLAFIALSLTACRKENDTYEGVSIQELYSDFLLLDNFKVDKDSVDFANGEKATFTAKFNKPVNWTITITGQTSKAKKIITGQSKTIDVSNGQWNGSTTEFPMFSKEHCVAQLTIDNVVDTFTVSTNIKSVKVNPGFIVADFENGFNPSWTKFVQSGANMDFNIKTDSLCPQGAKYLKMAGTVNWDYLIGLIDFPATAYGTPKTFPLNTNPDNVYFNCLIYGVPNTNESLVLFQFKEDEDGNGTYNNATTDDQYDYQITVNWSGWKLISIKYSDLVSLSNGQPTTPHGNSVHNPDKLAKISMLHLANPANGFASSKLDYIIFTDAPLEP
jgi:hypothetical protein